MTSYQKLNEQGEYPIDGNNVTKGGIEEGKLGYDFSNMDQANLAPKFRDVAFVALFWLNVAAWIFVLIFSHSQPGQHDLLNKISFDEIAKYAPPLFILVGIAAFLGAVMVALAFAFPRGYGFGAILFEIFYIIGAIIFACVYTGSADVVFIVCGIVVVLILLWTLYHYWSFIDYCENLIKTVKTVCTSHKGNYTVAIVGVLCHMIWMSVWVYCTLNVLTKWEGGALWGVGFHSLFTFYWVAETIRNVIHVTVAGSHAAWYFSGETYASTNPTLAAFRRATTYSFGSICFGSMLIAILQTLRRMLQVLQHARGRNIVVLILAIIARIVLVFIEALLRFFNFYIFTIVAIYGDSYVTAAKKTMKLFGERGFDMVMQYNIVMTIISASTIVGAFSCAAAGYGLGLGFEVNVWLCVVMGALVGVFVVEGAFVVMHSGSTSIMVCWLLHREKMQQNNPHLAQLLESAEKKFMATPARK